MNTKLSSRILALLLLLWLSNANAEDNEIRTLNVAQQAGNLVLTIGFKHKIDTLPPSFSVANPARIALDFLDMTNGSGKNHHVFNESNLRNVSIVQAERKTRVVLSLSRVLSYEQRIDGNVLHVTLTNPAVSGEEQQVTHFAESKALPAGLQVTDIGFRRGKDGEGRVVVELNDAGTAIDIRQQGASLIVDFPKTKLPEKLRRKLDVTDFATPVTAVTAVQSGENARVTITPKGLWEYNAYQAESQFVIEVKPIIENPNKLVQGSRGGYQGEKLSLNFQNVDVRRLLQVIGEFTGMNMVVSDSVAGSLTLILKDVPWDQALDIILQQRGLDMRKNGNVILIAPRDEIATKEKLDFESRQQIGDLEPVRTESFQLNYHKAKAIFDLLKNKDQTLLSKRGAVIVDERTNKLFVTDVPARLEDLRKLIQEIDIPMRQVMIEARIVEASDSFAKDLGMRLGLNNMGSPYGLGTNGPNKGVVGGNLSTTGYYTGQIETKPQFNDTLGVNLPAQPRSGTAGRLSLILFNTNATRFLNLEVSALEADGRGKIVSSPRVVTADQVEAVIEQGTELPYQQATSSGATSISFRKANLSLKVKPQITPDGKIALTLDVNKDSPNLSIPTGGVGYAIDTKHVKTEILVENGGTVVIGGIYQQTVRDANQRIPLLGEIPYLGWLFRNTQKVDDKSELLVFITPRIISDAMTIR